MPPPQKIKRKGHGFIHASKFFKLTDDILKKAYNAARAQMSQQDIAALIGIAPSTLSKQKKILGKLAQEMERGRIDGLGLVANGLFVNAVTPMPKLGMPGGNIKAQMFMLERKGGWKQQVEVAGDPENPIQIQIMLPDNGRKKIIDVDS
jgi:hypothetical protein